MALISFPSSMMFPELRIGNANKDILSMTELPAQCIHTLIAAYCKKKFLSPTLRDV